MDGAVVFGVVGGTAREPRVGYLTEQLPVTPELLAMTGSVAPTEVFRFGAPCAGGGCQHFDGHDCRLASKLVQLAPISGPKLPPCTIRQSCRWWRQEGKAACMRCPLVSTLEYEPSDELRLAADPAH